MISEEQEGYQAYEIQEDYDTEIYQEEQTHVQDEAFVEEVTKEDHKVETSTPAPEEEKVPTHITERARGDHNQ